MTRSILLSAMSLLVSVGCGGIVGADGGEGDGPRDSAAAANGAATTTPEPGATSDAGASAANDDAATGASATGTSSAANAGDDDDSGTTIAAGDDGDDGGDGARCSLARYYPSDDGACPSTDCIVDLTPGAAPRVLYDNSGIVQQTQTVATTDAYVLVSAQIGAQSVLAEIAHTGGMPTAIAPVAFWKPVALSARDGNLYIATYAVDDPGEPISFYRASTDAAAFGTSPVLIGAALGKTDVYPGLLYADGYLYANGDWGIGRMAANGDVIPGAAAAAFQVLATDSPVLSAYTPYSSDAFVVAHGYLFYAAWRADGRGYSIRRMAEGGGAATTIVQMTKSPHLAFDPATSLVFADAIGDGSVVEMADDGTPGRVVLPPDYTTTALEVDGTRLYATQDCAPGTYDTPFTRYADIATRETGYLASDPGFPFVDGPTGVAHTPSGTTITFDRIIIR